MAYIMWIWEISQVMKCVCLVLTARLDEFYGSSSVFSVSSYQLLGWTSFNGLMHVRVCINYWDGRTH